jgi:hypothetical protein
MAESVVNVTEGAGKKLHTFNRTIGVNSVEDEVVLFGENYLASYTVDTGNVSTATANSHILQIMAGASLKVRVRRIEVWQYALATAAALMDLRVYRLTTAGTGGTAFAAAPLDTTDAAAGAQPMLLPTVKGTEGILIVTGRPYMMQTIGASNQLSQPIAVWDFDRPRSKPLIIAAGVANGIAIKNVDAVAAGSIIVNVWLDESNF